MTAAKKRAPKPTAWVKRHAATLETLDTCPGPVRVAGLDLSLSRTGVSLYAPAVNERGDVYTAASIEPRPTTTKRKGTRGSERLAWFDDVLGLVCSAAEYAEVFVIEDYAHNARSGSANEIHGLGEHVRLMLWRLGIPYLLVPPTTLKKWACDDGHAAKEMMLREVYRRWGFEAANNDEADAHALARLGAYLLTSYTKAADALAKKCTLVLPARHREVLRQSKAFADGCSWFYPYPEGAECFDWPGPGRPERFGEDAIAKVRASMEAGTR